MTDILQAARSYYGLADAKVRKTEWFTDEGKTILCFEIVAEGEDFIGIVERMKRLQEEHPMSAAHEDEGDIDSLPPLFVSKMRSKYWALSDSERAEFANLADYISQGGMTKHMRSLTALMDTNGRKVAHIDAPETEEPTTMDAVWLWYPDTTEAQRMHASDTDDERGYLIPWAMLTDEQKQKAQEAKP